MKKIYFLLFSLLCAATTYSQTAFANESANYSTSNNVSGPDFKAEKLGNKVEFTWMATNESSVDNYEIQKSTDDISYTSFGTILTQNSAAPHQYTYTDGAPTQGYNYYRLSYTDKTGREWYSRSIKIDNSYRQPDVKVIGNPVRNGILNVQMANLEGGKYNLLLYNNAGLQVLSRSFDYTPGYATETVYLPQTLSGGSYFLQLSNGRVKMIRQVMIIQ